MNVSCPRTIPRRIASAWYGALRRTSVLADERQLDDVAVKLLLLLPKVGFAKWAGKACRSVSRSILQSYPHLPPPLIEQVTSAFLTPPTRVSASSTDSARARAVSRLIREGFIRKAASTLLSEDPPPIGPQQVQQLKDLHPLPQDLSNPFPGQSPSAPPNLFSTPVIDTLKELPRDSSGGPSGWTYCLMQDSAADVPEFLAVLERLCQALVKGTHAPLREWLCASRLYAVAKKQGGVRPIACGEAFLRLACRWALKAVNCDAVLLPEQFGVGSPGGVEPVVWAVNDAIRNDPAAVLSIDFSNAFNTVSRHRIAKAVRDHIPALHRLVKFIYSSPSSLLLPDSDGHVHILKSQTGVRQGDPLGPLLFSLAIKPLVSRLKTDFADRNQLWAYLDDLFLVVPSAAAANSALDALEHPDTVSTYGLRVNRAKCHITLGQALRDEGTDLLGSWVGGPSDTTSQGHALITKAVQKLSNRIPCLESLSLQCRLVLLRLCYFPTLNHLVRSLHPSITAPGTQAFDAVVSNAIASWLQPPPAPGSVPAPPAPLGPLSSAILQLPTRLGGLGLFSQHFLRPYAAGASFVLSQGVLRNRNHPLSQASYEAMNEFVSLCAVNLTMPVDTLLSPDECSAPHLQRRCLEKPHEEAWYELFQSSSNSIRIRLLENSAPLARSWLHLHPVCRLTELSDAEVAFALRRTLIKPLTDLPPNDNCRLCFEALSPSHHLTCTGTSILRTWRHNSIRSLVASSLDKLGRVTQEVVHGAIRHDILITDGDLGRLSIDIGVCHAPTPSDAFNWPTDQQVQQAILERESAPRSSRPHLFFWEDRTDEPSHPRAIEIRTFRHLSFQSALIPTLHQMETVKTNHFAANHDPHGPHAARSFLPFILSSGGCINQKAKDFVWDILERLFVKIRDRANFRLRLYATLAIQLIRFSHKMARRVNNAN